MKKGPKKKAKVLRFSPELELRTYTKGSASNEMSKSRVVKDRRLAAERVIEPQLSTSEQGSFIGPMFYASVSLIGNLLSNLSVADEYNSAQISPHKRGYYTFML